MEIKPRFKLPDSQNQTMIYDILNKVFSVKKFKFQKMVWFSCDNWRRKMFIFGGQDITTFKVNTTPEMIDLKNIDQGWILDQADSNDLFGNKDADE